MVESPVTLMIALREALVRRDRSASNEAVRALLAHDPPRGRQWKSIAAVAKQNGEISDAYEAMNRYAGPEPRSAEVIYELAALRAQRRATRPGLRCRSYRGLGTSQTGRPVAEQRID